MSPRRVINDFVARTGTGLNATVPPIPPGATGEPKAELPLDSLRVAPLDLWPARRCFPAEGSGLSTQRRTRCGALRRCVENPPRPRFVRVMRGWRLYGGGVRVKDATGRGFRSSSDPDAAAKGLPLGIHAHHSRADGARSDPESDLACSQHGGSTFQESEHCRNGFERAAFLSIVHVEVGLAFFLAPRFANQVRAGVVRG